METQWATSGGGGGGAAQESRNMYNDSSNSDGCGDSFLDDLCVFLEIPTQQTQQLEVLYCGDSTSNDSTSDSSAHSPRSLPPPSPPRQLHKPQQLRTTSAKKGGSQIKRTLDNLRAEAHQLIDEISRLRGDAAITRTGAMELAVTERLKRRRAEQECQQLRDAVYTQSRFIRGLRSVFSAPPTFAAGLTLYRYLHNYTRLPRDRSTRSMEYAVLAQDTRLRAAMELVDRETESIPCALDYDVVAMPCIQTELLPDHGGFTVTSLCVYAVDTSDIGAVVRGACVAVGDILVKCQAYKCTDFKKKIVDPDEPSVSTVGSNSILYRAMDVHHKNVQYDEVLSMESRTITLCKQTDTDGVVLWDFVDDDELHPISATTDITRQAIGASVVRRELCADGVERTVYRSVSTRRYRFHAHTDPQILDHFHQVIGNSISSNELLFRRILLEEVAKEKAAYIYAIERLGVEL